MGPGMAHLLATSLITQEYAWIIDGDIRVFNWTRDHLQRIEEHAIQNDVHQFSLDIWRSSNKPSIKDHWSLGVVLAKKTPDYFTDIPDLKYECDWGINLDRILDCIRLQLEPGRISSFAPIGTGFFHRNLKHVFLEDQKDVKKFFVDPYSHFQRDYVVFH